MRTEQAEQIDLDVFLNGAEELPPRELSRRARALCEASPAAAAEVIVAQSRTIQHRRQALLEAQATQEELRGLLEKLTRPPWFVATYLGAVETPQGQAALVQVGNGRRVVGTANDLDATSLQLGDQVFLNGEMNLIVDRYPDGPMPVGETGVFERYTADGRMVIRWHDEQMVVQPVPRLVSESLEPGDLVRCDRNAWLALERLEAPERSRFLAFETPKVGPEDVGGHQDTLRRLLSVLSLWLRRRDLAEAYGLSGDRTVLLAGPPGCGKTLMARACAGLISRSNGRRCRFAVVKPAEWLSPWVGQTEANIRRCFKEVAAAAGDDGMAILFLDEIEAIGRTRGHFSGYHMDRFLAALLAEIDGFMGRENLAIVSATNRKDLVDPALLERIRDVEITVGRPDAEAASEILAIHLPGHLRFSVNGRTAEQTRQSIIDAAVTRLYAPNADNELCRLILQDGSRRTVRAADLVSGRLIKQMCRAACDRAAQREMDGLGRGLEVADMEAAVEEAFNRLANSISPQNAHDHLTDLPDDARVVAVEPVRRRASQSCYLS